MMTKIYIYFPFAWVFSSTRVIVVIIIIIIIIIIIKVWYGHVKRTQEERLPKLIMEWITGERRKRGHPRKTWMEGVRAAMKTKHLRVESDQWLNRKK
jgi:uncharacterized membrane protein YqiK